MTQADNNLGTYYFSTGSRYSYLSMARVPLIEKRFGGQFRWVPVNGKRIRRLRGADPFQGPPQSGQYEWTYRQQDAEAWAALYGITFNEPESVEFDVELLLRAVIAAEQQGDIRPYAWALAQAVFATGSWPLDLDVVERVAQACELDSGRLLEDCQAPATQEKLVANCAEAVALGVFGTPTLMSADKLFWGNDRLILLEHHLQQQQQKERNGINVTGLDHVVLRSAAPEELAEFYGALLGCQLERQVEDFLWQLRLGDSLLDILRVDVTPSAANMDHFCLRVADYDEAAILQRLQRFGLDGQPAGRIYGAQGFGPSVYFVDPQGNRVELKKARSASSTVAPIRDGAIEHGQ
ncbi:MAG: DsbA family protein [Pseudomonadota bacterium]